MGDVASRDMLGLHKLRKNKMERKNWLWAMAGMGLLLPGVAQALGLGSLQVLSAPGEPFRAEIVIQSVTPQSASSLSANLAPASAFAMIDLPQAATLQHWHFSVRRGDQPAILISSPLPVSQPDLHFLVQLNWSGGQLVREYSARGTPASLSPSAISSQPRVTASYPPATSTPPPVSSPVQLHYGWSRVTQYGPVPTNGSLYDAARAITASNAVTLDQVMAALVKANPQAFNNNNPRFLYAGSMLKVPTMAEVQALAPSQATRWLSGHGDLGKNVTPMPASASVVASKLPIKPSAMPAKVAVSAAESATHLVLSSAPLTASTASTTSTSSTALAVPQAADMVALHSENQKLLGEVSTLGQRLNVEERLLASQGAQLATLSRNSASHGFFSNIPLLLSLGGNLLLLILFLWMLRRQQEAERRQREVSQRLSVLSTAPKSAAPQPASEPRPTAVAPTVAPAAAPTTVAETPSAALEAVAPVAVAAATSSNASFAQVDEDSYGSNDVDPIEQADLYLTYGKSESAIAVLSEALDNNPRRKELYVKLLDIYGTLDRREDYLDLAERMRGRFGPNNSAWQEVADQGARLFPGNALFEMPQDEPSAAEPVIPAPQVSPAAQVETVSVESSEPQMLDFQFGDHSRGLTTDEESHFPAEEKDRLLHEIDEQFRLMEEGEAAKAPDSVGADISKSTTLDTALDFASLESLAPETTAESINTKSEQSTSEEKPSPAFGLSAVEDQSAVGDHASSGIADWDAVGTKLDLAKAYVEMGDSESARDLLAEVAKEGTSAQREEAEKLIGEL